MGHIVHHAIVVTSFDRKAIDKAHAQAVQLGFMVAGPLDSNVNREYSLLLGPDGSKSGWEDSDEGDVRREAFRSWLSGEIDEDGGSYYRWVEVRYGDDRPVPPVIVASSTGV